jgi:hypothetical protein
MSIFNMNEVNARTAAAREPAPSTPRDQAILSAVNVGY